MSECSSGALPPRASFAGGSMASARRRPFNQPRRPGFYAPFFGDPSLLPRAVVPENLR